MRASSRQAIREVLHRVRGLPGRKFLGFWRPALEVIFFDVPVRIHTRPPQDELLHLLQRAVELLGTPTPEHLAGLLGLRREAIEWLLAHLSQGGGVAVDMAGRYHVPKGAPRFGRSYEGPGVSHLTRRLLCYWPEKEVLLPLLPQLRRRDLVGVQDSLDGTLGQHLQRITAWDGAEKESRGLRRGWELSCEDRSTGSSSAVTGVDGQAVLALPARVDLAGVSAAARTGDGVWQVHTTLGCRVVSGAEDNGPGGFTAAEPFPGLPVLRHLLGTEVVASLAAVFGETSEAWQACVREGENVQGVRRLLEGSPEDALLARLEGNEMPNGWHLFTLRSLHDAALLCRVARSARPLYADRV